MTFVNDYSMKQKRFREKSLFGEESVTGNDDDDDDDDDDETYDMREGKMETK